MLGPHFAFLAVFAVPAHLFPYLGTSCLRLFSKFLCRLFVSPAPKMCIFTVGELFPRAPLRFLHTFHLLILFAKHSQIIAKTAPEFLLAGLTFACSPRDV
jgi:hypothetical protein